VLTFVGSNEGEPMEQWKVAAGFNGRYEVSDQGRVRTAAGRPRKPVQNNRGYLALKLVTPRGAQRTFTIHALVAEAFLGARAPGAQVNHRDCNKQNNAVANLEWMTALENTRHAIANGRHGGPGGGGHPQKGALNHNAILSPSQVAVIRAALASGATGKSLAAEYEVSQSLISAIKRGVRW
jgi:hypothetical protein